MKRTKEGKQLKSSRMAENEAINQQRVLPEQPTTSSLASQLEEATATPSAPPSNEATVDSTVSEVESETFSNVPEPQSDCFHTTQDIDLIKSTLNRIMGKYDYIFTKISEMFNIPGTALSCLTPPPLVTVDDASLLLRNSTDQASSAASEPPMTLAGVLAAVSASQDIEFVGRVTQYMMNKLDHLTDQLIPLFVRLDEMLSTVGCTIYEMDYARRFPGAPEE